MPLTGKYDFKGIKSKGASGIKLALSSSPSTVWIAKLPGIISLLEAFTNFLANKGLIVMNLGAIYVNGEIDQSILDRSLDEGIKAVENAGMTLTPEQIKEIDDAVIKAADRALPYSR